MKICAACGEEKPLSEFPAGGKDGRHFAYCKQCASARVRQDRIDDPEKVRKRENDWRVANLERRKATERRAGQKRRAKLKAAKFLNSGRKK